MVVIEPEHVHDPKPETIGNPSEASSGLKSDTSATAENRDASDGFETASDGEHGDSGDDGRESVEDESGIRHAHRDQLPEREQLKENATQKGDSYEDALNDEELMQKAMAQVNDAKVKGNKFFVDGKYEEALLEYDHALHFAPEGPFFAEVRSICHSNRAACFFKLGKYDDTVKECTKALELNPAYIKALIRRGEAHEKLENFEESIADLKKVVELDPSNDQARRTIHRLEPLAEAKREKMKEEMIGKLKEMGNSLLGRFGMSVDNFKAVKDPDTGSYSISLQR